MVDAQRLRAHVAVGRSCALDLPEHRTTAGTSRALCRGMAMPTQPRRPCIFVLSARAMFRDGLLCFLQRQGFHDVTGAASIAGFWRRPSGRRDPDLVLLDLRQERADPGKLLHRMRERWPHALVVAL